MSRSKDSTERPSSRLTKSKLFQNERLRMEMTAEMEGDPDPQPVRTSTENPIAIEGMARIINEIESKFSKSRFRYYRFPGLKLEFEDLDESLQSLRDVIKYNLHSQNYRPSKNVKEFTNKISTLDFTKLRKKYAIPLKSDRESGSRAVTPELMCLTGRGKSKKKIKDKSDNDTDRNERKNPFLKGFLKRVNVPNDRDKLKHPTKVKLFDAFKKKDIPSQRHERSDSNREGKSLSKPKNQWDIKRKDLLLKYLQESKIAMDKFKQAKNPIIGGGTHRTCQSSYFQGVKANQKEISVNKTKILADLNKFFERRSSHKQATAKKRRNKSSDTKRESKSLGISAVQPSLSTHKITKPFTSSAARSGSTSAKLKQRKKIKGTSTDSTIKSLSNSKRKETHDSKDRNTLIRENYTAKYTSITKLSFKKKQALSSKTERNTAGERIK